MNDQSTKNVSSIKFLFLIGIATITALVLTSLLFIRTPTSIPSLDPNNQFVAVNLATSYLHRLQTEQSITEPTYFEERLTINDQLYKIEVMATTTDSPNTLHITVNVFSADLEFKGVAEGYEEITNTQNET